LSLLRGRGKKILDESKRKGPGRKEWSAFPNFLMPEVKGQKKLIQGGGPVMEEKASASERGSLTAFLAEKRQG